MKELNKQWRGENRASTVLSFPQGEGEIRSGANDGGPPARILGDLAIRADKKDITDRQLLHGVLHLLGYEHDTQKKFDAMRKKENEVLAEMTKSSK